MLEQRERGLALTVQLQFDGLCKQAVRLRLHGFVQRAIELSAGFGGESEVVPCQAPDGARRKQVGQPAGLALPVPNPRWRLRAVPEARATLRWRRLPPDP